MDMSGISKGRIQQRIAALKEEFTRRQMELGQYAAAIAELEELLKPGQPPQKQPIEYIEQIIEEHEKS